MKANRRNVGIQAFSDLWQDKYIQAASLDYINYYSLSNILNHSGYRSNATKESLLLCLKYFH